MAKKVIAKNTGAIEGAPPLSGQEASLIQGVFIALDSAGKMRPADFRASQGPLVARGVLNEDIQRKDLKGNAIDNATMGSYSHSLATIGGLSGLTQGATYWLHSGGAITATKPATATGDIDQMVGFAKSATELVVHLGSPVAHA